LKAERELIAYNDLKKWIIDPGFCTLCGACEAACPVHSLKIENGELHYTHDCSEYVEFCPICYDVCPHTESFLLEALGFITDAPYRRESLGYYRKVLLAQAVDPKLRELSHSGGVVTAILINSINKGFIDSAVTSRAEENIPLKLQPSVSLVPDDLLSSVDATYSPSAVASAFGKAVHEYGKAKIAFVGTPCQVLALRKLEAWEHKIMNSLRLIIGFMCLWTFSLKHLFEELKETYEITPHSIRKITMNKEYIIHMKDQTLTIPRKEIQKHILDSCLTCLDYTSQLADISVGGAYPYEDWSIVIVRTETGEEIFDDAVDSGVIRIRKIEEKPEVYTHFIEMANYKRKMALEEIKRKNVAGEPVPSASVRLIHLLPKELSLLLSLDAGHVMTKNVVTVSPETTIQDVLNIMMKHHHMGYPVLKEDGSLEGIVTFEDVIKVAPEDRSRIKVRDVIGKQLFTVHPDETALEAYEKMVQHDVGRILVVDRKKPKKLLGIITRTDIMRTLMWPMKRK